VSCRPNANGDPANLLSGSTWILQGIIVNVASSSPKSASVTNALAIDVTAGI
jgi:hypothetical protein